jgi:hypothetical protein
MQSIFYPTSGEYLLPDREYLLSTVCNLRNIFYLYNTEYLLSNLCKIYAIWPGCERNTSGNLINEEELAVARCTGVATSLDQGIQASIYIYIYILIFTTSHAKQVATAWAPLYRDHTWPKPSCIGDLPGLDLQLRYR